MIQSKLQQAYQSSAIALSAEGVVNRLRLDMRDASDLPRNSVQVFRRPSQKNGEGGTGWSLTLKPHLLMVFLIHIKYTHRSSRQNVVKSSGSQKIARWV